MKRLAPLLILAAAACSDPANPSPDGGRPSALHNGQPHVFNIALLPQNEVPPTSSRASGTARVTIAGCVIAWNVRINNPGSERIFAGHIHNAPAGVNGAIVQNFFILPAGTNRDPINFADAGEVSNCGLAEAILANPAQFYVNYHSREFPGGFVRGQFGAEEVQSRTFTTELLPTNEVPPTASLARGTARVTVAGCIISWQVQISNPANERIFAGHIHNGPAGVNGPVIQFFFNAGTGNRDPKNFNDAGQVSNCPLAEAILANPAQFYVNYHTREFPGGFVRGQLGS
ncbi:MAG: CHRD domain-containing protein [Gemmatimonadaceae bacterium]